MSNCNHKVDVLQNATDMLIIPFKYLSGLLCKEQNQMTTFSLGKMMTICQWALHWRLLSYYKTYMIEIDLFNFSYPFK